MPVKILAVGGEPATGKTTLFRKFMGNLDSWSCCKMGLLTYHCRDDKGVMVLGDYRSQGFAGTDKLSMAVQPVAVGFLRALTEGDDKAWLVLFEGDRLFNVSFLKECNSFCEVEVWGLKASTPEKVRRHEARNDTQNETWLKGRASKVRRVLVTFNAQEYSHESEEDTKILAAKMRALAPRGKNQ